MQVRILSGPPIKKVIMKYFVLALSICLLTACDSEIRGTEMVKLEAGCLDHGGIHSIDTIDRSGSCRDGTRVQYY